MSLWLAVIASSPPAYTQLSSRPVSTVIAQKPAQSAVAAVESVGMTVSDMDRAIDFYSQVLSFNKVSDVEVLGAEYEQLPGLFGARLHISGLRAPNGPGIEFLEYVTPKDGRPLPVDEHSNDVLHW